MPSIIFAALTVVKHGRSTYPSSVQRVEINFKVHVGGTPQIVESSDLSNFARRSGLHYLASGRYSALFVLNLLLLSEVNGVEPEHVVVELKALEGKAVSYTKPETEFHGEYLRGLWRKHFMPPLPSVICPQYYQSARKKWLA